MIRFFNKNREVDIGEVDVECSAGLVVSDSMITENLTGRVIAYRSNRSKWILLDPETDMLIGRDWFTFFDKEKDAPYSP